MLLQCPPLGVRPSRLPICLGIIELRIAGEFPATREGYEDRESTNRKVEQLEPFEYSCVFMIVVDWNVVTMQRMPNGIHNSESRRACSVRPGDGNGTPLDPPIQAFVGQKTLDASLQGPGHREAAHVAVSVHPSLAIEHAKDPALAVAPCEENLAQRILRIREA